MDDCNIVVVVPTTEQQLSKALIRDSVTSQQLAMVSTNVTMFSSNASMRDAIDRCTCPTTTEQQLSNVFILVAS